MRLKIAHLYPEMLNLYSDAGNVIALEKRLLWRGIEAEVVNYKLTDDINYDDIDIVVISNGGDKEIKLVYEQMYNEKNKISEYINHDGVMLAIGRGFQLLGQYFYLNNEKVEGLGILEIFTEKHDNKLIGNVVVQPDFLDKPVVGFENHSDFINILDSKPFAKVLSGNGNGDNLTEGVFYKNVIGTNLHGPLLPKNPHLADYILTVALNKKYGNVQLSALDDSLEADANHFIVSKYAK